jgi:MoxR-like ATPase
MSKEEKKVEELCRDFRQMFDSLRKEIGKVIVGYESIVENVLISLFCGGHVLLEGVPGLGKTLLVRTLSDVFSLDFRRIQFTPDLMPADIIGTNIVMEDQASGRRRFEFQAGPIFGQIILADEINRATPKTQSAMLEAMQEHSVTSGGQIRKLPEPFMVLATQNPIEQEGTYPLPEAQLDRFFFKILVPYSNRQEKLVQRVVIAEHVRDYAIRLVLATHPQGEFAAEITNRFVRFGSSPRGVQALVLSGKVRAMLDERYHVSFGDISTSVLPALRHRILLNFEGQAEGITTDEVLGQILESTPKTMEQRIDVP